MTILEMKEAVLDCSKQSYSENLFAGTSGNLSICDHDSELVAITPTSILYPTMTIDDVVVITYDGNIVDGQKRPSSEWRMHTEIYKNRKDVGAVVHTHSPNATAFAVAHKNIPVILIEMLFFLYGDVPVAEYQKPGSKELGIAVLKVLKNRTSCLLSNHGVLSVGKDINEAHIRAVYTEDAAKIYINAKTIGNIFEIPMNKQNEIRRQMGITEE